MTISRDIPEAIKRSVRQRCGFGCVICGHPIVEYDHIDDYSKNKRHDLGNLTLLCRNHHGDKTHKRIPIETLRYYNNNPYVKRMGWVNPYGTIHQATSRPIFNFGSNVFYLPENGSILPIVFGRDHLVLGARYTDGLVVIHLDLKRRDGKSDIIVVDNEITYSSQLWDVVWKANRLLIRRSSSREISLALTLSTAQISLREMRTFVMGHEIHLKETGDGVGVYAGNDPYISTSRSDFEDSGLYAVYEDDDGRLIEGLFPFRGLWAELLPGITSDSGDSGEDSRAGVRRRYTAGSAAGSGTRRRRARPSAPRRPG